MNRLILICFAVTLAGCNVKESPSYKILEERFPDNQTVRILTDESGNRYVVKRHPDNYWHYQLLPYETTVVK